MLSQNFCYRPARNRAHADLTAHNGRVQANQPVVRAACGAPRHRQKPAKRAR
jgi:hypothetical protein